MGATRGRTEDESRPTDCQKIQNAIPTTERPLVSAAKNFNPMESEGSPVRRGPTRKREREKREEERRQVHKDVPGVREQGQRMTIKSARDLGDQGDRCQAYRKEKRGF
jgi:hypothetical protein